MTPLQKKIRDFLDTNKLSISALEKKAGLKMHSVYNILNGTSKHPRTNKLEALAHFMGCSVRDFYEDLSSTSGAKASTSTKEKTILWNPHLYLSIIKKLNAALDHKNISLDAQRVVTMAWEAYKYALINNLAEVDDRFINWLVNQEL